MTRDPLDRLDDILHAIGQIDRWLAEDLPDDALHDALCFQLVVNRRGRQEPRPRDIPPLRTAVERMLSA